jgi:hypothetical protein
MLVPPPHPRGRFDEVLCGLIAAVPRCRAVEQFQEEAFSNPNTQQPAADKPFPIAARPGQPLLVGNGIDFGINRFTTNTQRVDFNQ